ncbi:hypothetical protein TWF132_000431 [Orbilia oligospora]|nr:hypothetical protein TWF132_000431 [Orbilia oligospora]
MSDTFHPRDSQERKNTFQKSFPKLLPSLGWQRMDGRSRPNAMARIPDSHMPIIYCQLQRFYVMGFAAIRTSSNIRYHILEKPGEDTWDKMDCSQVHNPRSLFNPVTRVFYLNTVGISSSTSIGHRWDDR